MSTPWIQLDPPLPYMKDTRHLEEVRFPVEEIRDAARAAFDPLDQSRIDQLLAKDGYRPLWDLEKKVYQEKGLTKNQFRALNDDDPRLVEIKAQTRLRAVETPYLAELLRLQDLNKEIIAYKEAHPLRAKFQADVVAHTRAVKALPSFCDNIGLEVGTQIELEDGQRFLLGDEFFSYYDDCSDPTFEQHLKVVRYRVFDLTD